MSQTKSTATDGPHEHVHGPDCEHDHSHHHEVALPFKRETPKLGRNDPCHCGSGKKFKKCHGVG